MTNDIIERVARAFWNAECRVVRNKREYGTMLTGMFMTGLFTSSTPVLWDDDDMLETDRARFRKKARAAIEAMREPDVLMVHAGIDKPTITDMWQSMIDAALAHPTERGATDDGR